jgi:hypothetical protein
LRGQLFIFLKQRPTAPMRPRDAPHRRRSCARVAGDRDVALVTIEDGEADLYIRPPLMTLELSLETDRQGSGQEIATG